MGWISKNNITCVCFVACFFFFFFFFFLLIYFACMFICCLAFLLFFVDVFCRGVSGLYIYIVIERLSTRTCTSACTGSYKYTTNVYFFYV